MHQHYDLGAKARRVLREKDKKMKTALTRENHELAEFRERIASQYEELERGLPKGKSQPARILIHVYATADGYATVTERDDQPLRRSCVGYMANAWHNTLEGIVTAFEAVPVDGSVVMVLSESNLAEHIASDSLERWEENGWLDPITNQPRKHQHLLRAVLDLKRRNRLRVLPANKWSSPRLKLLKRRLNER